MNNKKQSNIKINDYSIDAEKVVSYYYNDKSKREDACIERTMDLSSFDNYVRNLFQVDKNKMMYEITHHSSDHEGYHVEDTFSIPVTMLDLYDRLDEEEVALIFEKHRVAIFTERVFMRSKSRDIAKNVINLIKGLK